MSEFQIFQSYREYSKDVWDYLIYMPYMPSRSDRDNLSNDVDKKRVKIWDYFFRIKPEDVGIPQSQEIADLKKSIDNEIVIHDQRVKDTKSAIENLRKLAAREEFKRLVYGLASLLLGFLFARYILLRLNLSFPFMIGCLVPFWVYSLVMFIGAGILLINERSQVRDYTRQIRNLHIQTKDNINISVRRIRYLETLTRELKGQIPIPPADTDVRTWLNEDFERLWNRSKEVTGLGTRLLNIRDSRNPIPVLGPGELQHSSRIPPQFTAQVDPNRNKHLLARRAFYFEDYVEVLYGVYYIEYILIADDMLATCGLFYDFIRGKESSEQTTEQYYKDVVAIATTKEFRQISVDSSGQDIIYLDDAPTFTLSLADGEKRTVTFVNEKYFKGIKEKINISEDSISKIYWIRDSEKIADNAIKALRFRLRIHKGTYEDNPNLTV